MTAEATRYPRFLPPLASIAALLTWAVATPLGIATVRSLNFNPLSTQGPNAQIAFFLLGVVTVGGLALLVRSDWFVGLAAGLWAAWCGSTVAAALVGTPYGFGSMGGDAGRISALVTYFATTSHPSDAADPSLPPEYPPLYPMIVGRIADITGQDAWRLLPTAQALLVSASVIAGFVMWRRLVPSGVALTLSATSFVGLMEPSKGNEILSLTVFLPLVLGTFSPPEGRRPLNPIVAGVMFGVMVPLYPNFVIFSLLGLALVILSGWRRYPRRRAFVIHCVVTVVIAAALASWYLGPLIAGYLSGKTEVVADLFKAGALSSTQFPLFSAPTKFLFAIQAIGAVGLIAFWRKAFWARPLSLLVIGILVVRGLMLLRFAITGHSFLLLYVPYLLRYTFTAAGVLALFEVWQLYAGQIAERIGTPLRLAQIVSVAMVVASLASVLWTAWTPSPKGSADRASGPGGGTNFAYFAHNEYLPDGTRPAFSPASIKPGFPADDVYRAIDMLGAKPDPVVLSTDQRLFSFRHFRSYLQPNRESSNALMMWDSRRLALQLLPREGTPATMADSLAHTPFGPIDVLVLKKEGASWMWRDLPFNPGAFSGPQFAVKSDLPEGYIVVVRTS